MARRDREIRIWSPEDDVLVMESDKPAKELALELSRTTIAVYRRKYKLRGKMKVSKVAYHRTQGFARNSKHCNRWNQDDSKLVLETDKNDEELHHQLGRSMQAIQMRRFNLLNGLVSTVGII